MLTPCQFSESDDLPSFYIPVAEVRVDEKKFGPTEIPMIYDEGGEPVLSIGKFFPRDFHALNSTVEIRFRGDDEPWPLILTKRSIKFEQDEPEVEAQFTRLPFVLESTRTSQRFEAVLFNAPKFISKPIILIDETGSEFNISPLKSKEGSPCLVTSNLKLDADDPFRPLSTIIDFLTFVKGSHCGIGNLFAFDESDSVAFKLLGFSRIDRGDRETNWFDIEIQHLLPEIFLLFSKASADKMTKRALRQTISFYRASNVSRSHSLEMSIIGAHGALEAMVNFVLSFRAGWSKRLLDDRSIPFSEKSRAACSYFGMRSEVLEHSPELFKLSKARNSIDVFEIISFFRNKLVHQDEKFEPSGLQLHEAWLISQWLVEVLVFGVIGYRGKVIDRRIYGGWRGTTCEIPLERT